MWKSGKRQESYVEIGQEVRSLSSRGGEEWQKVKGIPDRKKYN